MSQRNAPTSGGDPILLVDATSGNETVYLPRGFATGRKLTVRRIDATGNTVTVALAANTDALDGATNGTTTVSGNGEKVFLTTDPGVWESFGGGGGGGAVSSVAGATGAVTGSQILADTNVAAALAAKSDSPPDVYLFSDAALPKTSQAFARVRAGVGDCKLLMVGDSTFNGGNTIGQSAALPSQLVNVLVDQFIPAANGLGIVPSNLTGVTDSRWTVGAGWSKVTSTIIAGWGGHCAYVTSTTTTTLVYADPRVAADRFDVYYYITETGGAPFSVTATGGSAVPVTPSATQGIYKVTASAGSASTSNSVTMQSTGAGGFRIIGVDPWNSTSAKVRVGNAGVNSATAGNWTQEGAAPNGVPAINGTSAIKIYAPDLTIVQLGANDAATNVTASTYMTNVQAIIDAAKLSGDVMVMSPVPTSNAPMAVFFTQYQTALKGLTTVPLIDIWGRSGQSWSAWDGKGYMYDDRHPSAMGAAVEAQIIGSALRRVLS